MTDAIEHLQNPLVNNNIIIRNKIKSVFRSYLESKGFHEYDTPILIAENGEAYNPAFHIMIDNQEVTLADSPQMFKMLLHIAGYHNYYQFAHCFRPIEFENAKHTRLCEFTQADVEAPVQTLDELVALAEELIIEICKAINIIPSITHIDGIDCRDQFQNSMKPDFRTVSKEISVVFIERMPLTNGEVTDEKTLIPCHHIFALPTTEPKEVPLEDLVNLQTESFDIVINGIEVGGGDLRIYDKTLLLQMMNLFHVRTDKFHDYLCLLEKYTPEQSGGFALGLERLVMALSGCNDIRQTVCFPDFYKRSL